MLFLNQITLPKLKNEIDILKDVISKLDYLHISYMLTGFCCKVSE